ncbi:type II toxin-antitoxin system RelE/ParE family toxin [Pseudomonas sp. R2.Fl]|nr:type II toxin-antitoxin system RelE/ParE family toxin [Pseudomonas sp. R2.Fl]
MKYRVEFAPEAIIDFQDLYDYLLPRAGEHHARNYVADIYRYCLSLESFPVRGLAHAKRPGLRTLGYRRRATIAYRVRENTITVVRLFHRGRKVEFSDEN